MDLLVLQCGQKKSNCKGALRTRPRARFGIGKLCSFRDGEK